MTTDVRVAGVEVLGSETIRVWRAFRLRRWLRRWWLRVTWRPVHVQHILLTLDPARGTLQAQCHGDMACLTCGGAIALPTIPDGIYSATTFGCARCHSYYYVDTAPQQARYDTIRRQLAEKAQA
jgi:hypothetical protein